MLSVTHLQGADLALANLQGSYLNGARMQGTYLGCALLKGANLVVADLRGANLNGAQLQSALFFRARLEGALLLNLGLDSNTSFHEATCDETTVVAIAKLKDGKYLSDARYPDDYIIDEEGTRILRGYVVQLGLNLPTTLLSDRTN